MEVTEQMTKETILYEVNTRFPDLLIGRFELRQQIEDRMCFEQIRTIEQVGSHWQLTSVP